MRCWGENRHETPVNGRALANIRLLVKESGVLDSIPAHVRRRFSPIAAPIFAPLLWIAGVRGRGDAGFVDGSGPG